nr:unnamed protein product [Callosobruchus analis]
MSRTCCVPGCKSDYNSTLNAGASVSSQRIIFEKNKWLKAILRDDWFPSKYSVVCALHFLKHDIIREDIYQLPDGSVKNVPIKISLKSGSFPSIFPNLPKYISKNVPVPRRSPAELYRLRLHD